MPPVAHRFKPGVSGNPGGLPRSSVSKLLRDVLEAGEQKYTKRIVQSLIERACEGSLPAIKTLLAFAEHLPPPPRSADVSGPRLDGALVRDATRPPSGEPAAGEPPIPGSAVGGI